MEASSLSTIAQLLFAQNLSINFAKLVGEVNQLLEDACEHPFKASWDCDTVVSFDQPGTRVLLGWNDLPGHALCGVLTLSVGPSTATGKPVLRPDADVLCNRLAAALQSRLKVRDVLWHRFACYMSADWVELLAETVPVAAEKALVPAPMLRIVPQADRLQSHCAQDLPEPAKMSSAYADIRTALYGSDTPETPRLSPQMRLAVHALNATLIMVWGPFGGLAMAHGVVKGENMRLSAQLIVLTGLASAVLHSPNAARVLEILPAL